jgi:hypothetical protein
MNEPDFRDYRRLSDEQAENIFAMRDHAGANAPDRPGYAAPLATYRDVNTSRTAMKTPLHRM